MAQQLVFKFKDADSAKEFAALQTRLTDTSRQLNVARQTLQLKTSAKKRNEAYKTELAKVPPSTTAYKGVGKMFMRTTIPDAQAEFDQRAAVATQDIGALQKTIDNLEKTITDDEKSLRELLNKNFPPKKDK